MMTGGRKRGGIRTMMKDRVKYDVGERGNGWEGKGVGWGRKRGR